MANILNCFEIKAERQLLVREKIFAPRSHFSPQSNWIDLKQICLDFNNWLKKLRCFLALRKLSDKNGTCWIEKKISKQIWGQFEEKKPKSEKDTKTSTTARTTETTSATTTPTTYQQQRQQQAIVCKQTSKRGNVTKNLLFSSKIYLIWPLLGQLFWFYPVYFGWWYAGMLHLEVYLNIFNLDMLKLILFRAIAEPHWASPVFCFTMFDSYCP